MMPDDHNKEWFQVTVVFGNFDSKEDATDFRDYMKTNDMFVSDEIKGSWHK
jgi:hypothetical protein